MEVIPAINCLDFACVKKRFTQILELGARWVHIDISDGKFTPVKTWNNPKEFNSKFAAKGEPRQRREIRNSKLNVEVHLMVQDPESYIKEWAEFGAERVIVHAEATDFNVRRLNLLKEAQPPDIELGLALKPETRVTELVPYLDTVTFIQLLSVTPGFSSQKFQEDILAKIKSLKALRSNVTIEVDGGINAATAKSVREAGAHIIVSASYILDSADPKAAYQKLKSI